MCGIAGIISYENNWSVKKWLCEASQIIRHRGNDDDGISLFDKDGVYCSKVEHTTVCFSEWRYLQQITLQEIPERAFYIGLLHRRLSIIDLSEMGHQPMCDESGQVWITYNGEVYNYLELRKELVNKGYSFFSHSDTEVVLKAYLYYGKEFVKHLNGMWAFCIYDSRTRELVLSRDRLGVKPLYYCYSKGLFAFASEQKVFVRSKLVSFGVNYSAVAKYLIDNVLEDKEESVMKAIYEVQPGQIILVNIDNLKIRKDKYFELEELAKGSKAEDEREAVAKTDLLVRNSIYQHLRSDVEVGVALSGGIDSSVIAVVSADDLDAELHTFSVVFPENAEIDESKYVEEVNRKINGKKHFVTPTVSEFFRDVDELLYSQDIPIWSTSTYNQFLLMRKVKESGLKVILSGQGSDELFAGYQHHYVAYWLELMKLFRFSDFIQHIQKSGASVSQPYMLMIKTFVKNFFPYKKFLFSNFLSKDVLNLYEDNSVHSIGCDLDIELLKDLSYRRLKAFLKCEDRCSMWYGVESRLPFSDDMELMRWAFQVSKDMKIKNGISKYVLREAFREALPISIYARKDKRGFDAPLKEWLVYNEGEILSELKNGMWNDIVNDKHINKINSIKALRGAEVEVIFKLFLLNRWRKVWEK